SFRAAKPVEQHEHSPPTVADLRWLPLMNRDLPASKGLDAPTNVRYGVLGFVCPLSMITYLDRVGFWTALPHIVHDLGLPSVADLKWAFTAFAFAYAVF